MNLVFVVALVLAAAAAFCDVRSGHIPNRLVAIGAVGGAVAHFVASMLRLGCVEGSKGAAAGVVLGTLACALVPLLLYRFDALGGGDVKLLGALGAALGPALGLEMLFYALCAAALYAPVHLIYAGRFFAVVGRSALLLVNPLLPRERQRSLPPEALTPLKFGPFVLLGVLALLVLHWRA